MNQPTRFRLKAVLPHEALMCLMLLQLLLRLVFSTQAYGWMAAYLAVLLVYAVLITAGRRTLAERLNRIRLLWNVVAMNFAFTSVKYVIPALQIPVQDARLIAVDALLVGGDLSVLAQRWYNPLLTEIMSLGYMLFIVFLVFSFVHYGFKAKIDTLLDYCSGLFALYALGITGYTLVPAQGHWVALADQLTVPVEGYVFTWLNKQMVAAGSASFDVFPSLHVGVGLYMLLFFRRYDRSIWRVYLAPFVFLVLSTIYLRYHYFIDLVCGAALSLACFYSCSAAATCGAALPSTLHPETRSE